MMRSGPAIVDFVDYPSSVPTVLEKIGAGRILSKQDAVLIKPNLVSDQPFPVTTSPECCEVIIDYIRSWSRAEIVIAEGTGNPRCDTSEVFDRLGYTRLASDRKITLVDLNNCPLVRLKNHQCRRFPEFFMPKIAMDHFIISVPVLKAHSLSAFTGTLKNMIGFAPPAHYAGNGGIWNKAEFHIDIHQSIRDINRYRHADLTMLDASVGLAAYHLGGPRCDPPVGKLLAGLDPLSIDKAAAGMLGLDWREIGHLSCDYL
jgi:uncharacterized protein (DUF362 family)